MVASARFLCKLTNLNLHMVMLLKHILIMVHVYLYMQTTEIKVIVILPGSKLFDSNITTIVCRFK